MSATNPRQYMKDRRAELRRRGICVDCQRSKVHVNEKTKQPHSLCKDCLQARRDRWRNGSKPPLLKLIEKAQAEA